MSAFTLQELKERSVLGPQELWVIGTRCAGYHHGFAAVGGYVVEAGQRVGPTRQQGGGSTLDTGVGVRDRSREQGASIGGEDGDDTRVTREFLRNFAGEEFEHGGLVQLRLRHFVRHRGGHGHSACCPGEVGLRGLAAGYVAGDAGEHPAVAELHFAHREVDIEDRTVSAASFHLAAGADDVTLARFAVALEVPVVFGLVRLGHQQLDVLPDHFGRPEAEEPFGRGVHCFNNARLVDRDDGVDRSVEHRLALRLCFGERGSRFPLCGQVPH